MKDAPLIVSLLIALIIIMAVGGVSILVKMNSVSDIYNQKLTENLSLKKELETFKSENVSLKDQMNILKKQIEGLQTQIKDLEVENVKLVRLKNKLEENLKEELMKNAQPQQTLEEDKSTLSTGEPVNPEGN